MNKALTNFQKKKKLVLCLTLSCMSILQKAHKTITISICRTKYYIVPIYFYFKQAKHIYQWKLRSRIQDNYSTHYTGYLEHLHRFSYTNESIRFTGYQIYIVLHYSGTTSSFLLLHLSNLLEASSTWSKKNIRLVLEVYQINDI